MTSDPDYGVLHDCAEFTYNASGMFCNTTMVDMFSVPLSIRLTGAKDQTTGTLREGGRAAAFAAVREVPEFGRLVVDDTRIIARPGPGRRAVRRGLLRALHRPNDGTTGPVAAILGAGFNRSTLVGSAAQPMTDPASFYRTGLTNHYAKAMHAAARDGKAYGFAFDDVADFASYVQDTAPTGLRLTLTPF
ncbi:hypothetical protein GCM10010256_69070 [Streptomyces coeruleorubidus]|nr:hypothetical protein GCM10010256_69070 [Streptomyces coeruleorubidus]